MLGDLLHGLACHDLWRNLFFAGFDLLGPDEHITRDVAQDNDHNVDVAGLDQDFAD